MSESAHSVTYKWDTVLDQSMVEVASTYVLYSVVKAVLI